MKGLLLIVWLFPVLALAQTSISIDHIGPPTPTTPLTHMIHGTISGSIISGVTLTLGPSNATTTSAPDGTYSFPDLASGSYTVTASMTGHTFAPIGPVVIISNADQVQDFVADVVSYSISGALQRCTGDPNCSTVNISAVNITCTPGCPTTPQPTAADGTYSFTGLAGNTSYTLSIALAGVRAIIPNSQVVSVPTSNVSNVNFQAWPGYNITGTINAPFQSTSGGLVWTYGPVNGGTSGGVGIDTTSGVFSSAGNSNGQYYVVPRGPLSGANVGWIFSCATNCGGATGQPYAIANVSNAAPPQITFDAAGPDGITRYSIQILVKNLVNSFVCFTVENVSTSTFYAPFCTDYRGLGTSMPVYPGAVSPGVVYRLTPSAPGWHFNPATRDITIIQSNVFQHVNTDINAIHD